MPTGKPIFLKRFSAVLWAKNDAFSQTHRPQKRAGILSGIAREFATLLDEKNGIVNAEVTSVTNLSESQQKAVTESLEGYTGKKIRASMKLNGDLIGGLSVKIGDTILDGSVRYQLQLLRETLVAGEV